MLKIYKLFTELPKAYFLSNKTYFLIKLLADREHQRTLPCGPWFLVRRQRRIWDLTSGKNKFTVARTERPAQKDGPSQERHQCWHDRGQGFFKTGLLCIYLSGCELTVLIDSCKLHNNRLFAHIFPIIESVIIRCMYIWNIYEHLIDAQLSKVTWGHSCASRMHVPELKSLWLSVYSLFT